MPSLRLKNPALWWPNGFGDPHLYPLHLTFVTGGASSDAMDFNVGMRTIWYTLGDSDNLALVVNGVRVFAKGGNWGMDEAMKRVPRERLEAEMRLHRDANYTIVRNWVGQSTSEDFYDLADRYGLLVWDEFFQPAAGLDSGRERGETGEQDLSDVSLYLANVREKVLRFRNHPSIALWCGRNEGAPSPRFMADRPRRDHGRARSAARLSAGFRRGAWRAIRRPVLVAAAGELLRRGPWRAAHAVQDRDRLGVDPDARSDLRDDAGRRRRALPQ